MKPKIGILYATVDGQTKKICDRLEQVLQEQRIETEVHSIHAYTGDLSEYQTLVMGASIRYGKHHKKVHEFIADHQHQLEKMHTAFFSVNLVARKAEKNAPDTNPYMVKFLKSIHWKADLLEVFGGKLDYQSYGFFDRLMIKLIMKMTHGPTQTTHPIEYTDWDKVADFGRRIAELHHNTPT